MVQFENDQEAQKFVKIIFGIYDEMSEEGVFQSIKNNGYIKKNPLQEANEKFYSIPIEEHTNSSIKYIEELEKEIEKLNKIIEENNIWGI